MIRQEQGIPFISILDYIIIIIGFICGMAVTFTSANLIFGILIMFSMIIPGATFLALDAIVKIFTKQLSNMQAEIERMRMNQEK